VWIVSISSANTTYWYCSSLAIKYGFFQWYVLLGPIPYTEIEICLWALQYHAKTWHIHYNKSNFTSFVLCDVTCMQVKIGLLWWLESYWGIGPPIQYDWTSDTIHKYLWTRFCGKFARLNLLKILPIRIKTWVKWWKGHKRDICKGSGQGSWHVSLEDWFWFQNWVRWLPGQCHYRSSGRDDSKTRKLVFRVWPRIRPIRSRYGMRKMMAHVLLAWWKGICEDPDQWPSSKPAHSTSTGRNASPAQTRYRPIEVR
jgi:hypothetical protein